MLIPGLILVQKELDTRAGVQTEVAARAGVQTELAARAEVQTELAARAGVQTKVTAWVQVPKVVFGCGRCMASCCHSEHLREQSAVLVLCVCKFVLHQCSMPCSLHDQLLVCARSIETCGS